jgi:hypothetical protein
MESAATPNATKPKCCPRRNRFHLTRRIPMGRTAVMAIIVGWSFASILCCASEPNAEQARAIAAIKELGGRIVVDDKGSDNPVVSVDFTRAQVTEAGLKQLSSSFALCASSIDQ